MSDPTLDDLDRVAAKLTDTFWRDCYAVFRSPDAGGTELQDWEYRRMTVDLLRQALPLIDGGQECDCGIGDLPTDITGGHHERFCSYYGGQE